MTSPLLVGKCLLIIEAKYKIGRTLVDVCLTRRKELYLKTNNTHNRQTSIIPLDSNPLSQQAKSHRTTH